MKHLQKITFFIISLFYIICIHAQSKQQILSPNGNIAVEIGCINGNPYYNVKYRGGFILKDSPLGLKMNIDDYSKGLSWNGVIEIDTINNQYSLPNIKKSQVQYKATQAIAQFYKDSIPVFDIEIRVSNCDVAFRYNIYKQGETISGVILEEASGFAFPENTTTFLAPQSHPMNGFARTSPSYETSYILDDEVGKNGFGEGYTFPCLFRIGDKGWCLISETGVDGSYCASRLFAADNDYRVCFPQQGENNGNGSVNVGISLPYQTPWRTITVGENLSPIVETTAAFDLVEPQYEPSCEYKYTKGTWSWIIGMDSSCNFEEQTRYIDFSAAMGYETVLIDALWDVQIGREKMAELAKYGASKGVGIYLWYNSNGYWNDAPQSPRNIMNKSLSRRREMEWMKNIGIKGIKVDFFGGDKQCTMQLYEDILTDANDYGLMVIFHGCTLPRGWERMYPNYASSEAVLASENLHFSQWHCDMEAINATIHPFIRNTVGSMDFGGSALNKFYNYTNNKGSQRKTSDVFALATAVLFQSGVQHFALAPNNLYDAPSWAIDFMKEVPTTWDEVRFIDGYPGRYIVLARRCGNRWYIVGVNAQKETINLKLDLSMIKSGELLNLYSDNKDLQGQLVTIKMNKKQTLLVEIPCNGAFVLTNKF